MEMRSKNPHTIVIVVASLTVVLSMTLAAQQKAAQDRYTVKALNGVSFSEFKGYDEWQDVAVSRTDTTVKAMLGNPAMIKAYKSGIPANGQPFPDGVKIVKIMWAKKTNPVSPYAVEIPDTLAVLAFIEKDSKRFPDTSGWGYAQFNFDAKSGTFTPYGKDASFGKTYCYDMCHSKVKATDYIFTAYPLR
jgi:hypothetical protein